MAYFKFTEYMLKGKKIEVYNHGNLTRDFTYIDDLVSAIRLLVDVIPSLSEDKTESSEVIDSKSPVAPFRLVNIGNSQPEHLSDFIRALEKSLGVKAKKNFMPMQPGDVPATWADTRLLDLLTGYRQKTNMEVGVARFVDWYRNYYSIKAN